MSSKKYATPLRLELKPSKILFYLFLSLHLAAVVLVYLLFPDFRFFIPMVIFIIASGYFVLNKYALKKSPNAVLGVIWDANNEWMLKTKVGDTLSVELMRDSYVNPMITILLFKQESKLGYISVILLKDNIDENDFRRLRVRLKVGQPIDVM